MFKFYCKMSHFTLFLIVYFYLYECLCGTMFLDFDISL